MSSIASILFRGVRPSSLQLPRHVRAALSRMLWISATSLAVASSGCAALWVGAGVAAGAGTVAYVRGSLVSTEAASIKVAWQATLTAMGDLQYTIAEQKKDALEASLVATTARNRTVRIKLDKATDSTTTVSIRVGTWGDEQLSRSILDAIRKRL